MVKFFKLYLDFLRNLTVQTTLFAVAVIVSVESHLDISKFDFSNTENSIPFVCLMVMTVMAVIGNIVIFLDGVGELKIEEDKNHDLRQKSGLARLTMTLVILYRHYKVFSIIVCFSLIAIMYGVVVTWFVGMPLMAGIYNAIHAK